MDQAKRVRANFIKSKALIGCCKAKIHRASLEVDDGTYSCPSISENESTDYFSV